MTPPKNMSASVRQRLLNLAKRDRRPFSELLQYYAMERFLYRLSRSVHADRFVLKGALMLRVWRSPELRPTMDIDILGRTNNQQAEIVSQIQDISNEDVEEDGLIVNSDSIQVERIIENAEYEGLRVRFPGTLGSAKLHMQIDIGFGDIVYPEPVKSDLPVMLDFAAPRLLCYSRESAIAEKLEAMVKLGILNSRMKDFYDIWLLSRQFDFVGAELAEAIRLTFKQRGTKLPSEVEAFTALFIETKKTQWTAFRKRLNQESIPKSFKEIVAALDRFLSPVVAAIKTDKSIPTRWTAAGPWA